MANLTVNQQAFISFMERNDELARHGFTLLLTQADPDSYFETLKHKGFFEPSRNPAPQAVDDHFFRVPYWSPLDYLVAVAKVAGRRNDLPLAEDILTVLRSVTTWKDETGQSRDNYHTARKFAEMLGVLPPDAVTAKDLDLIPIWLTSKFERSLVGNALDEGALTAFLESPTPSHWEKALTIARHCTAISWVSSQEVGPDIRRPQMPIDNYWLNILVKNHAARLGQTMRASAAELFLRRVEEVFGADGPRAYSHAYRPAVEEHEQNHSWQEPENICVRALRDALLGWCDECSDSAKEFALRLTRSPHQMVRRIGIYVIDQRWDALGASFLAAFAPTIFDLGHFHELYNLLMSHFRDFPDGLKEAVILAIKDSSAPAWADSSPPILLRTHLQWLSAVAGKGYAPADDWYEKLSKEPSIGRLGAHPEVSSFIESHAELPSGLGAAPSP